MVAVKQVVLSRTHTKESEKVRNVALFIKLVVVFCRGFIIIIGRKNQQIVEYAR